MYGESSRFPSHLTGNLAVISGDTLVLRGRPGPQGQPPKERFAVHPFVVTFVDSHLGYCIWQMSQLRDWVALLEKMR
jgi:hypothetical protein